MPPSHLRRWLILWPLLLLLLAEALALVIFTGGAGLRLDAVNPLFGATPLVDATLFSLLVAGLILLSGLLPALLRPGPETLLAGCLATVLAALVVLPFEQQQIPPSFNHLPLIQVLPPPVLLRLVNGVWVGPLALHVAVRFPLRNPDFRPLHLAWIYLISLGLLLMQLWVVQPWARLAAVLALLIWNSLLIAAAGYSLLQAGRRVLPDNPRPAQQARLLFASVSLAMVPGLLRPISLALGLDLIPYNLFLAALAIMPVGIAYAVLRHDLFGIDRVLRRALTYALFSLLALAGYFALLLALAVLLTNTWPELRGAAALTSVLLAALVFDPARRWLQHWIDRLLYPDRLNFQRAVQAAREQLEQVQQRADVLRLLTEDLPPQLGAQWAGLSLAPAPDVPGHAGEVAWNAPLIVAGRALGRYWLGPRRAGPSYDRDEQAQLAGLAGQAALALAYADTIETLQALNAELEQRVEQRTAQVLAQQRALAAYAERQNLARELHDSVSQALFSINLSARALRPLVQQDPVAAASGLSELEAAARQALAEMRALLTQLRSDSPPGPADAEARVDLAAELRQHCAALAQGSVARGGQPLAVALDAPAQLWLPPAPAYAALAVAREALHNVLKHSGVASAACELRIADGSLLLSVRDDGRGFDERGMPPGYGLRGMQERSDALGGSLSLVAAPGAGVSIQLTLPLPPAEAD